MGLGTHALHRLLSRSSRQRLLALAYDLGIRYFDTAPSYGAGLAERELGRFGRGRRLELVLTTKFGIPAGRLAGRVPGLMYGSLALRALAGAVGLRRRARRLSRDYGAHSARVSIEGSLRALGTDYIDILYLHEPTLAGLGDAEPLTRTLEALKADGKIRHLGLSGGTVECEEIARAFPPLAEVLQLEVPKDPDGWPVPEAAGRPTGVRFWEFAPSAGGGAPERLTELAGRLRQAAPQGVLMISTSSKLELHHVVNGIEKAEAAA